MGTVGGIGHFVSWDGGCLLIGCSVDVVPVHAHYAIQIAFGSAPGIRFRADERAPWTAYAAAIIPSRVPHSMDATAVAPSAVLFVEPETPEGRALAERWLRDGIAAVPEDVYTAVGPALFAAWQGARSAAPVERAARDVIDALTGGLPPLTGADERIGRAAAYVRAHLDGPLTLEDVSAVACLSPSRFRHLFVQQTGMALRPYILWRRFLRAWELLMKGTSLTTAAHAAGFADAAHLTRTSRRMFGFPPSALLLLGSPGTSAHHAQSQPLRSIA